MPARPRLLFVAPITPAPTGGGLAMRAFYTLSALAEHYTVDLLEAAWYPHRQAIVPALAARCNQIHRVPVNPAWSLMLAARRRLGARMPRGPWPCQPPELAAVTRRRRKAAAAILLGGNYDVVHFLRLYTTPLLLPLADNIPPSLLQVDLDDLEPEFRLAQAALCEARRDGPAAASLRHTANLYARLEQEILPGCRYVFVASPPDRERLAQRHDDGRIRCLPNVVPIPATVSPPTPATGETLLFLGTLGYAPNQEALDVLLTEVLPSIRRTHPAATVLVAGAGLSRGQARALRAMPAVRYLGAVPEVAAAYAQARLAAIPLRLGGGTRIKILEAFAHQCPVVTTVAGSYGLAITAGKHLLLGETPAELASQCSRVLTDGELAETLRRQALELVRQHYTPAVLPAILAPESGAHSAAPTGSVATQKMSRQPRQPQGA